MFARCSLSFGLLRTSPKPPATTAGVVTQLTTILDKVDNIGYDIVRRNTMTQFTGKAESRGVSLPTDMWAYLTGRREQTGISVSVQIRRAIEADIMDRVADKHDPPPIPVDPIKEAEFLYPEKHRAKPDRLVDACGDYEISPASVPLWPPKTALDGE